jgi:hypothetical protein
MNRMKFIFIILAIALGVIGSSCNILPGNQEPTPTPQVITTQTENIVISEGNLVPVKFTHLACHCGDVKRCWSAEATASPGQVRYVSATVNRRKLH